MHKNSTPRKKDSELNQAALRNASIPPSNGNVVKGITTAQLSLEPLSAVRSYALSGSLPTESHVSPASSGHYKFVLRVKNAANCCK